MNEGGSTSSAVLSKSTVHRKQQRMQREAAEQIKDKFHASKSVVQWDNMLLPDMTGVDTKNVDRLPVMISSLADGNIKLLGVLNLISGAGKVTADAVLTLLKSRKCDSLTISMCFDTTASNTGRHSGGMHTSRDFHGS